MISRFTYSVLQYKHNLILGESINVGILFYFPEERLFELASGDNTRPKLIYPDFDNGLYNAFINLIFSRVKAQVNLFTQRTEYLNITDFIRNNILSEDASGLIFCEPVTINVSFTNREEVINHYSKLLLPGINIEKSTIIKHNDTYILKKFHDYVLSSNKNIEKRFTKNEIIQTNHFRIKFDYAYETQFKKLIKPISFDFEDETSIQTKAAVFYSYITDLSAYNPSNRYDFILAKPQKSNFINAYENALDFLNSVKANKKLVTEDELGKYTAEIISELSQP